MSEAKNWIVRLYEKYEDRMPAGVVEGTNWLGRLCKEYEDWIPAVVAVVIAVGVLVFAFDVDINPTHLWRSPQDVQQIILEATEVCQRKAAQAPCGQTASQKQCLRAVVDDCLLEADLPEMPNANQLYLDEWRW